MSIVQVIGTAGSGKTTIMGANAIVQAMEGKKVYIFSDEHATADVYMRANEWIKADLDNLEPGIIFYPNMYTGAPVDVLESIEKLPEVVILDLIPSPSDAYVLQVHQMLAKVHRNPVVYNSIQVSRNHFVGDDE